MNFLAVDPIVNPVITGIKTKKPEEAADIFANLLSALVGLILIAGSLWAFYQLLSGGLLWISSGGDKGKLETARERIFQAMIGLVILFAAWAFYLLILNYFGLSSGGTHLRLPLPSLF